MYRTSLQRYTYTGEVDFIKCSCAYTCVCVCQVSSVQFPRLKEVDDVLGGQAAWENVDTTEGVFWPWNKFFPHKLEMHTL